MLDTGDMKLITAIIVIIALILPQYFDKRREKSRKAKRMLNDLHMTARKRREVTIAETTIRSIKFLMKQHQMKKLRLDHINLTLKAGDFVTVIGSNGAGKSTLMNMISGALTPDFGDDCN